MKTEKELNAAILKISLFIQESYPELSKYIGEMPASVPNKTNPEISLKTLSDYLNSLEELVTKYAPNHKHILN